MNEILQRAVNIMAKQKMSMSELERRTGMTSNMFGMWKRRDTVPSTEWIVPIADALGVSPLYLLTGMEEVNIESESVKIKVLGRVAAGVPIEAVEDIIGEVSIDMNLAKTGEFFGLRISGDSMEPRMYSGDVVVVRQQEDVESGQIAIVIVNGEEATCKKVEKHENGIMLVPLNKSYSEKFYSNEDIEKLPVRIIGRVVEVRGRV